MGNERREKQRKVEGWVEGGMAEAGEGRREGGEEEERGEDVGERKVEAGGS